MADVIASAAEVIRQGGLVAFPTETVYGLGANALDADAVARIYHAKQRALNDPLIVHCALSEIELATPLDHLGKLQVIGELPAERRALAGELIRHFWPGPLTLVLPRGARIPTNVTAGLDSVAVRMPSHAVALALIERSGVPIAAPSANRFGHVSPTTARHVLDDLDGRIDVVLDGGPTPIGVESTVLDLTSSSPRILRPGGLAREQIEAVIGPTLGAVARSAMTVKVEEQESWGEKERGSGGAATAQASPGMLSKHYAPRARLEIVADTDELLRRQLDYSARGLRVGLLILESQRAACEGLVPQFVLGADLDSVARNLYAGLRALDADGVDMILVNDVPASGLGTAIGDRLRRGAARD
jgi:L-threonylcarbamoyladenylate synthase